MLEEFDMINNYTVAVNKAKVVNRKEETKQLNMEPKNRLCKQSVIPLISNFNHALLPKQIELGNKLP